MKRAAVQPGLKWAQLGQNEACDEELVARFISSRNADGMGTCTPARFISGFSGDKERRGRKDDRQEALRGDRGPAP